MTKQFLFGPSVECEGVKSFTIGYSTDKMCTDCVFWFNFPKHMGTPNEIGYCNEGGTEHYGHILMFDHVACRRLKEASDDNL